MLEYSGHFENYSYYTLCIYFTGVFDLYNKDELDLHFHFDTINKTGLLW